MTDFLNIAWLRDFHLVSVLIRLALSILVGGMIGMERGKHGRAAGLRTHILVCLGSALTPMIGLYMNQHLGMDADPLRIAAQVISGIGFLGAGTILVKGRFQITGLTTASGLWATAAIGLCLGAGFYEGGLIAALLTVIAITVFSKLELRLNRNHTRFGIYLEVKSVEHVRRLLDHLHESYTVSDLQVTPPRSATPGHVGIEASIYASSTLSVADVARDLENLEEVSFALESI